VDPRACDERSLGVMTSRIAVVTAVPVLASALAGGARPAASAATVSERCGPHLCIPIARGWFGSVGPGVTAGRPAAWLLAGNFRFPSDAARHEGIPSVPKGKVLISVGDFPVAPASAHWPRVQRLRFPRPATAKRAVSWHVRFAGRAVPLSVHFGSAPNPETRRLTNARLSAIHPRRR
jgi:hypothetical protein